MRLIRSLFLLLAFCLALLVVTFAGLRLAASLRETQTVAAIRPSEGTLVATAMGAIYIETAGDPTAPPVLLAHGTAAWSRLWQPTAQALAGQGYYAIAFDMPPFGYSQRDPQARYDRRMQAARILALTDALGIRPVLVAHSFGAGPAAEAAMIAPESFRALVMVDGAIGLNASSGPGALPLPLRSEWLREVLVAATVANPLATRTLLRSLIHVDQAATAEVAAMLQMPGRITGSTRAMSQWLPSLLLPPVDAQSTTHQAWRNLTLPLGLIWGSEDTVTPPDQAAQIAELAGQPPLVMLEGVGHIPQLEDPQGFNAALIGLLASMGLAPQ